MPSRPPSLRHRRVVTALQRLREEAGLSLDQAAAASGLSRTKISNIETLKTARITGDDTKNLCEAYGASVEESEALAELARQSGKRGWWHVYSTDILGQAADLVELEADAREILSYKTDVIPGLLQTEDYARALMRAGYLRASRDEIEQRVELRMTRQKRAADVRMWAVIGETALLQSTGGHDVMAEQLERLASEAEGPNVTIQVMPLDHRGHAAMGVPFSLLRLGDGAVFGYQDGLIGGLYLEAPDTDRYQEVWAELVGAALDFDRSLTAIRRHAARHREQHGS